MPKRGGGVGKVEKVGREEEGEGDDGGGKVGKDGGGDGDDGGGGRGGGKVRKAYVILRKLGWGHFSTVWLR